jgi:1,4-alpha-glucan branching enzyme
MGGELGQAEEWNEDRQIDWSLAKGDSPGRGIQSWVRDLNQLYRSEPALWDADFVEAGFRWVNCNDREASVLSFLRRDKSGAETLLVVINFTPVPRNDYRVGVPATGRWEELLNSDAAAYGGSNLGNDGGRETEGQPSDGLEQSLVIELPPLALVVFRLANLPLQ